MNNKDKIQAAHLEAIEHDLGTEYSLSNTKVSNSCTTITAEAIGEAMEWVACRFWVYDKFDKVWFNSFTKKKSTTAKLVTEFLNQKAK